MTCEDLLLVGHDGSLSEVTCNYQPTTDTIATWARPQRDRFVIQLVGEFYEVYDVRTLRRMGFGGYTIGMPKFSHRDEDRAVAWAIGEAWSEV